MIKQTMTMAFLIMITGVSSATPNKCEIDGKIIYQAAPCPANAKAESVRIQQISRDKIIAAREKLKQDYSALKQEEQLQAEKEAAQKQQAEYERLRRLEVQSQLEKAQAMQKQAEAIRRRNKAFVSPFR